MENVTDSILRVITLPGNLETQTTIKVEDHPYSVLPPFLKRLRSTFPQTLSSVSKQTLFVEEKR